MKTRKLFLCIFSICLFSVVPIRLLNIYRKNQDLYNIKKPKRRLPILDRNGNLLAGNVETQSVFLDPSRSMEQFDTYIIDTFGIDKNRLSNARQSRSKFLSLKRHCDKNTLEEIKSLRIPGVYFLPDIKREYPFRELLSTITGFCDSNGHGKHGVEYAFDQQLSENSVTLSIDVRIQNILYQTIREASDQFNADGASGIVVDVASGEILGMVSVPSPIEPIDFLDINKRNRNLDPVEVGSVLKLHNTAMALESGLYDLDSIVDGRSPFKIGKFEVTDLFGLNRLMSVREAVWHSSNIAHARIANHIGPLEQKKFFEKIGLLGNIEWLQSHSASVLKPHKWSRSACATISYGYGIGITSLHLIQSALRMINGYDIDVSLTSKSAKAHKRLLSKRTVDAMREVMREVVTKSNRKILDIKKCDVGAKTGTSNMCVNGKYIEGQNFVTLISMFPSNKPKYIILMQMTNPKKEFLTQGTITTAANVLSKPMANIIKKISVV